MIKEQAKQAAEMIVPKSLKSVTFMVVIFLIMFVSLIGYFHSFIVYKVIGVIYILFCTTALFAGVNSLE